MPDRQVDRQILRVRPPGEEDIRWADELGGVHLFLTLHGDVSCFKGLGQETLHTKVPSPWPVLFAAHRVVPKDVHGFAAQGARCACETWRQKWDSQVPLQQQLIGVRLKAKPQLLFVSKSIPTKAPYDAYICV